MGSLDPSKSIMCKIGTGPAKFMFFEIVTMIVTMISFSYGSLGAQAELVLDFHPGFSGTSPTATASLLLSSKRFSCRRGSCPQGVHHLF